MIPQDEQQERNQCEILTTTQGIENNIAEVQSQIERETKSLVGGFSSRSDTTVKRIREMEKDKS